MSPAEEPRSPTSLLDDHNAADSEILTGPIGDIARVCAQAGGRLLIVGGWVRDRLNGEPSNDFDLEVFGLEHETVDRLLEPFGFTPPVGKSFPVWRQTRTGLDLAFPRDGAADYRADSPESLNEAFQKAARHRDLTMNAMAWDPLAKRLLDPCKGAADLAARRLSAADPKTFARDPLRTLRVARLAARFDAEPTAALIALCRSTSLAEVPIERIAGELRRILCELPQPWRAIEMIDRLGQLGLFPPVAEMVGVPQDPTWHPEGDVFLHTGLVVDCAAEIAVGLEMRDREILMWSALAHDFGKVSTTTREEDGRVRALGHEAESAALAAEWLSSLRLSETLTRAVARLVTHHLAPAQFVAQNAGARAYRRLARKLAADDVGMEDLERLARADHLGRTTEDALAGRFEAGTTFLEKADAAQVRRGIRRDVVEAAHLMTRGVEPGPELGRLLTQCREIQDETGWQEPEVIIERVFEQRD